jgi:hypothetical protein
MQQYLGSYAAEELHIPLRDLLSLGRDNLNDESEYFKVHPAEA